MYKNSHYNLEINHQGNLYLFNSFSGAVAKIDKTSLDVLLGKRKGNENLRQQMLDEGFMVDADFDEKQVLDFSRANSVYRDDKIIYRILTTSRCNARCFYCYEKNLSGTTMSADTAQQVSSFITRSSKNSSVVQVQWFGGEPLLNTDAIELITNNLKRDFESSNITPEFTMVTNGLLFTPDLIKKAVDDWMLVKIQISLDGDEEEYRTRKGLRDAGGLFKVLDNIERLVSEGIETTIRLNYDDKNIESIFRLIEMLATRFSGCKNIRFYPYPLFGTYSGQGTLLALYDALAAAKLDNCALIDKLKTRKGTCFARNASSFVIGPEGNLYKCAEQMSNIVGDVWKGPSYNKEFFYWCNPRLEEECEECVYLPLCQGGCRAGHSNAGPLPCFLNKDIVVEAVTRCFS